MKNLRMSPPLARELFPQAFATQFDWPRDQSIVDAFPREMSIRDITGLLSSVGFSSPPSWLRPFRALSNGERQVGGREGGTDFRSFRVGSGRAGLVQAEAAEDLADLVGFRQGERYGRGEGSLEQAPGFDPVIQFAHPPGPASPPGTNPG